MSYDDQEPARVKCTIMHETEKALLVKQGGIETWVPRSQLTHISKDGSRSEFGKNATIEMPEWLAEDKCLDYQ